MRVRVYGHKFIASAWWNHETSGFGGWQIIGRWIETINDWVKNIIDWWSKGSCNGDYRGNDRWRGSGRNSRRRFGVKICLGKMFNLGHSEILKPIRNNVHLQSIFTHRNWCGGLKPPDWLIFLNDVACFSLHYTLLLILVWLYVHEKLE